MLKRFWSGEMTNARLASELREIKPGLILLRNNSSEVPFQDLLISDYHLVYQIPIIASSSTAPFPKNQKDNVAAEGSEALVNRH